MELMIRKIQIPATAGGNECAMELIAGIFHPVFFKDSFQTALVKSLVVGYQRKVSDFVFNLLPNLRKGRCIFGVLVGEAMHLGGPRCIVVG